MGGVLSAEEVRQIAEGEDENPDYAAIVALSEVFDVSTDYWHAGSAMLPMLDTELLDALGVDQGRAVLRVWSRLSAGYRGVILNLLKNLEELEADELPN